MYFGLTSFYLDEQVLKERLGLDPFLNSLALSAGVYGRDGCSIIISGAFLSKRS
jgi:hypothetical protein